MAFKDMIESIRKAVLCCGGRKKRSLEPSSPTNVRRGVLDMPGLTEEQRDLIREKASTDAARLLSLTSHPPTQPSSSPTSIPQSLSSSREPSATLLNKASSNLPESVPTPPRQMHSEAAPPPSAHGRMKGLWDRTRRLSSNLSANSHSGYQDLGKEDDEGVVMLTLDFKDMELDSGVSGKSVAEDFEVQDCVGGHENDISKQQVSKKVTRATKPIPDTGGGDSSSDDEAEGRPLVAQTVAQPVRV